MGFEKGKGRENREPSGLPSGWQFSPMPTNPEAWHWGQARPKAPGVSLDPARLGQSLAMLTSVGWMVWPGSFFIEGVVLLHKASQSVSLTVTVMNSNKMSKKGCLDGAWL